MHFLFAQRGAFFLSSGPQSSVDCGTILGRWSTIRQSSLEVAKKCVLKHLDKWSFKKVTAHQVQSISQPDSHMCSDFFFTFAVVEKLLCEDWYVKHSSVLPLCILLMVARDKSKSEKDKHNSENIWPHRLTERGGHLSSWAVGGWVIDFIPGHGGNTVIQFKKWGGRSNFINSEAKISKALKWYAIHLQ